MRSLARAAIAAGLCAALAPTASAQRHEPGPGWHGDIHHFHDHDFGVWRGGHWFHGNYGGRLGWWWVVGPSFYFYPTPIYPYPDPYVPPVVTVPPAAAATWYYCPNPPGYYPYVTQCPVPWQPVQAPPAQ